MWVHGQLDYIEFQAVSSKQKATATNPHTVDHSEVHEELVLGTGLERKCLVKLARQYCIDGGYGVPGVLAINEQYAGIEMMQQLSSWCVNRAQWLGGDVGL